MAWKRERPRDWNGVVSRASASNKGEGAPKRDLKGRARVCMLSGTDHYSTRYGKGVGNAPGPFGGF